MANIRAATIQDLPAITEIYNEAILTTTATFDNETKTVAQREPWFKAHDLRHPILVAEIDGAVIAWASLSQWSDRCAYADTAELSIYVRETFRNRGLGKQLMAAVMDAGERCGLHTVISRIEEENQVSIHLHEQCGFEDIGVMREVGRKFGRLLDVRMMQLIYPPAENTTNTTNVKYCE